MRAQHQRADGVHVIVQSFQTLLEQAAAAPGWKNATGNIRSLDDLLQPAHLEALERHHPGVFAFLAFHPNGDRAVADYVRGGTLSSDSGPGVLVLFVHDVPTGLPTMFDPHALGEWISLDHEEHPAYEMVRLLFAPERVPPLPGIVFFERFTTGAEPLYVHLHDLSDEDAVRRRLRSVFSLVDAASRAGGGFVDRAAAALQKEVVPYQRVEAASMREWLFRGYRLLSRSKGDIVTVLSSFV
jgi:hypothetical protein